MAQSRKWNLGPYLAVGVLNALLFAGGMAAVVVYGFDSGTPLDIQDAGWPGLLALPIALLAAILVVAGGVVLRLSTRIPSLLLMLVPGVMALFGIGGLWSRFRFMSDALGGEAVDPASRVKLLSLGVHEALNNPLLGAYLAALLSSCAAITVALRHWPSRGALNSGGRAGILIGLLMTAALVALGLLWRPFGLFGFLPAIGTVMGLVTLGIAAHAVRNDPLDEANRKAAGDLWNTLLLCMMTVLLLIAAGHTQALISATAIFREDTAREARNPDLLVAGWTEAGTALLLSMLYLLPLPLAAVSAMLSRGALGTWGLRRAGASLAVSTLFVLVVFGAHLGQAYWMTHELAETASCGSSLAGHSDANMPVVVGVGKSTCDAQALVVGRTKVWFEGTELGSITMLDTEEGCKRVAEGMEKSKSFEALVLIDGATPYRQVVCLTAATARVSWIESKTELFRQVIRPGFGRGSLLPWLVRPTGGMKTGRWPFTNPAVRMSEVATFSAVPGSWDQGLLHIHVSQSGLRLTRSASAAVEVFDGSPSDAAGRLVKVTGGDAKVGITADPEVPMSGVLSVVALYGLAQLWSSPP